MFRRKSRRDMQRYQQQINAFPQSLETVMDLIRDKQESSIIYQALLRIGVDLLQIDSELAYLRTVDPASGITKLLTTLQSRQEKRMIQGDAAHQGITGRAITTGQPQRVADVRHDPDYVHLSDATRSELAVPILNGMRSIGVLNFEAAALDWFTEEDVRWMTLLAQVAGLAATLEQGRTESETAGIDPAVNRNLGTILAGSREIPLASSYGDESAVAAATPYLLQ